MKSIRAALTALIILLLFTVTCAAASAEGTAVLHFPADLHSIEEEAFCGNASLQGVILPEMLDSLGPRAFADSKIDWVCFPGNVPEGGIAEDAFENTEIGCVIARWDSYAGHWAEEHGYNVVWENNLEIQALDGGDWRYVPWGEETELRVQYRGAYTVGCRLDWFRVEQEADGEDRWVPLDKHGLSLTTEPVEHYLRYVCRVTDAFGFTADAWCSIMVDNGQELRPENGVDRISVPAGERAELRVKAKANDEEVMDFQWFRIDRDENGWDQWVELEGETGDALTTEPVTEQQRYACRFTDKFGSMIDCWITVDVEAEDSFVSSGRAQFVGGTSAVIPLTYSVTSEIAEGGYRIGVVFSENSGDLVPDENGELPADRWTWGSECGVYGPCSEAEFDGVLDELMPNRTYFYSACLVDEDDRVILFLEETIQRFRTGSGANVQELALDEHAELPAEVKQPFRFTAPRDGIYAAWTDRRIDELKVYRANGDLLSGDYGTDRVFFPLAAGETVYLFARSWEESADLVVFFAIDFPSEDAISAELSERGSTWADIALTFSATEETAGRGYYAGLAFSPDRSRLETLNDRQRFNCDMWEWEMLDMIANDAVFYRHVDQLTPDRSFYFRPYLLAEGKVLCYGDILEVHTAPAGDELQTLQPGMSVNFSGGEVTPVRIAVSDSGLYTLRFDPNADQADIRGADGTYIANGSGQNSVSFYVGADEPVYAFLRSWDAPCTAALDSAFVPAPTEDAIDARIAPNENGRLFMGVRGSVTPETARGGYGYRLEYSPFATFKDEYGNPRVNILFRQNGDGKVRVDEADVRPLPPMVPGTHFYYRAVLNRFAGTELFGEVHEFTVPEWEVPGLSMGQSWTELPANTPTLLKFTADAKGFVGFEGERLQDFALLRADGAGIRAMNPYEHDNGYAFLIKECLPGEIVYLRLNGDEGARIRAVPAEQSDFTLGEKMQPLWDNHFVRFTAGDAGWYKLHVDRAELAGNMVMTWDPQNGIARMPFADGNQDVSIYLPAGQTVYFAAWYNMNQNVLNASMTRVSEPGSIVCAVLLPEQSGEPREIALSETWTAMPQDSIVTYSFTAKTAGTYAVEAENIYFVSIQYIDGELRCESNLLEMRERKARLRVHFDEGETLHIRAAGEAGARLRVTSDGDGTKLDDTPVVSLGAR